MEQIELSANQERILAVVGFFLVIAIFITQVFPVLEPAIYGFLANPLRGVFALIPLGIGVVVIFWTREWSHDAMFLELCHGDKKKAGKLHDKWHADGFI